MIGMLDRQLQDVLFNGNYYKQRIEQLAQEPPELQDLDRQLEALEKAAATRQPRVDGSRPWRRKARSWPASRGA